MKVLLVSPAFHGYWQALEAALASLGHDATAHCYDSGDRFGNALAHRLPGSGFAERVRERAAEAAVQKLRSLNPDAVLVVKGDALGDTWWDAVATSGVQSALWLYDELERMSYTDAQMSVADQVYSYSPNDVQTLRGRGIGAEHLADGYDSLTKFVPTRVDGVSFIGARYPERERLLRILARAGEPAQAWGREWSRHPWDIVRTRRWTSSGVPAHRDIARAGYYGVMAGSTATLNVHGEGHDGLSMRTFEAPGVGALQLIDRPEVERYYEVGAETLVFRSDDELIEHVQRARREPAWALDVREAGRRRTLAEHTLVHRMQEVTRRWA